jgi:hypothetical protein
MTELKPRPNDVTRTHHMNDVVRRLGTGLN